MMARPFCVLTLVACLRGSPAAFAQVDTGASTYVSDHFIKLARSIARQYISGALTGACPSDRPLCEALLDGVTRAFEALVDRDVAAAPRMLNSVFVEGAVVARWPCAPGCRDSRPGHSTEIEAIARRVARPFASMHGEYRARSAGE